ncbi:MAG TPA: hypothetical protein VLE72_02950 [Candidatus Saccharimonadales bacterium]|nr:hypothetical protein [Candidatus Saccharimonadales bacterium]
MKLAANIWIEGAYYVDFDSLGQLRIVGPNNHLHYGSVDLYRDQLNIKSVFVDDGQLVIEGEILASKLFLHDPVMGHIRRLRDITEREHHPLPTYAKVYNRFPNDLAPHYIGVELTPEGYKIEYRRSYDDHWYGTETVFDANTEVHRHKSKRGYYLDSPASAISFRLRTITDSLPVPKINQVVASAPIQTEFLGESLSHQVDQLLDRTALEITHLVRNNKTSGYGFGTIITRDWMESAELGQADLTPEALSYMYHQVFEFINAKGEGWHENITGEFKSQKEHESKEVSNDLAMLLNQSNLVTHQMRATVDKIVANYTTRNMIDIEPRYLLALGSLGAKTISPADLAKLKRVAGFIVDQARRNDLITFKKVPNLIKPRTDQRFIVGDWRDSSEAFRGVGFPIAPYDVNVVLYPKALDLIHQHAKTLSVDRAQVAELITKWQRPRGWYGFSNQDGTTAFALALYDVQPGPNLRYQRLEVNHLDEAYDLFYGVPTHAQVESFALRLLDPNYFYTDSGPTIVGAGDGYTTLGYHGRVIWAKQTALAIAGLQRQLNKAKGDGWPAKLQKLITTAVVKTSQTSIDAWLKMGDIPELYYDKAGVPHFYNDQPTAEGRMNLVQLWSDVGARRIIRTYSEVSHAQSKPTSARH